MTRLLIIAVLAILLYQVLGRPEPASIPETIMEAVSARVSVENLVTEPQRYDGWHVTVTGRVVDRAVAFGFGAAVLADDAGHQLYLLGAVATATPGTEMTVSGRFDMALAIGDLVVPVLTVDR